MSKNLNNLKPNHLRYLTLQGLEEAEAQKELDRRGYIVTDICFYENSNLGFLFCDERNTIKINQLLNENPGYYFQLWPDYQNSYKRMRVYLKKINTNLGKEHMSSALQKLTA